jgi:hypothetical protein
MKKVVKYLMVFYNLRSCNENTFFLITLLITNIVITAIFFIKRFAAIKSKTLCDL